VDVSLGLDAKQEEEGSAWTVVGAEKAAKQPWLGATMQTGDSETADEMIGAVIAGAFPNLSTVIEEATPNISISRRSTRQRSATWPSMLRVACSLRACASWRSDEDRPATAVAEAARSAGSVTVE
jgi:hypothetical protein